MSFELIKIIHISCAIISGSGFFLRGILLFSQSALMQQRLIKVIPHIVDTVLLLTAITMLVAWKMPLWQPWIIAKIVALLVYIGLGMVALRFGKTIRVRLLAWILALLTFGYIISVAMNKSVLGFAGNWAIFL